MRRIQLVRDFNAGDLPGPKDRISRKAVETRSAVENTRTVSFKCPKDRISRKAVETLGFGRFHRRAKHVQKTESAERRLRHVHGAGTKTAFPSPKDRISRKAVETLFNRGVRRGQVVGPKDRISRKAVETFFLRLFKRLGRLLSKRPNQPKGG